MNTMINNAVLDAEARVASLFPVEIDGVTYRSESEWCDAFAPGYDAGDWAEIATMTEREIDFGNRLAMPGMSEADYLRLMRITVAIANCLRIWRRFGTGCSQAR